MDCSQIRVLSTASIHYFGLFSIGLHTVEVDEPVRTTWGKPQASETGLGRYGCHTENRGTCHVAMSHFTILVSKINNTASYDHHCQKLPSLCRGRHLSKHYDKIWVFQIESIKFLDIF